MTYDLIGHQLGPYRVDALVGTGGMAEVYKAYQPSMDRYVALKALPIALSSQPEFLERFRREAILIASLNHTHILPVYDYGQADRHAYLVMPLMENGTIASRVAGRRLPVDQVIRVGTQVGDALDFAHTKGMVHRDVKPGNILLDTRGNCLLSDFGIATLAANSTGFTTSHGIIGTPAYISPEQADGGMVDGHSDQYSLAVVLYELATGRRPFDSTDQYALIYQHLHNQPKPIRSIDPTLPEQLEWAIMRGLNKLPSERFATTAEMVRVLRNISFRVKATTNHDDVSLTPVQPVAPEEKTVLREPAVPRATPKKPMFTLRMPKLSLPARPAKTKVLAKPGQPVSRPAVIRPITRHQITVPRKPLRLPDPAQHPYVAAALGVGVVVLFAALFAAALPSLPQPGSARATLQAGAIEAPTSPAPAPPSPMATALAQQPEAPVRDAVLPSAPTETPISGTANVQALAPNCPQQAAVNGLLPVANLAGQLGCPSQAYVANRRVLVQVFERGAMILFARPDGALEGSGGTIYVLGNGGRAWRYISTWSQPVSVPVDNLYVCQKSPGLTPGQSGVPWRHFGRVWCDNAEIQRALGAAQGDEFLNATAAFQSYDNGRVFQISGWDNGFAAAINRPISVFLRTEREGEWE